MKYMTKLGYKSTEVGVIPEDWVVRELGEVFDFKNGLNKGKMYFGKGTPIVNYMDVFNHRGLYIQDIKGEVTVSNQEQKNFEVRKGDVLFTRTSETIEDIGITSVILDELQGFVFSGFLLRARPKNDLLKNSFKQYCFSSTLVRKGIVSLSSYTTRALTNGKLLSKVKIPYPPTLSEQKAIADALSDMDALIEGLEGLIGKKRAIKMGAMQALLMEKEGWVIRELGEVMDGFSSGQTPYRAVPAYYKGDIPWITSGELNYNIITDTIEKITIEGMQEANLKIIPSGTFLIAITGLEAAGTRGSCAITGIDATTNQSCMALYPKKGLLITSYLYHYYVRYGNELAFKYCQGTKQQSFTAAIAKKLPIALPPTLSEQTRIANILSDMDAELVGLEGKLAKYRQVKQGMMQDLLTGRVRLV
jgi:type I restriction enzyme, S subunit